MAFINACRGGEKCNFSMYWKNEVSKFQRGLRNGLWARVSRGLSASALEP